MSPWLETVVCWLGTFAVHGALLAALALALSMALRERALAWQEGALRLALVGALLTSALQWWGFGGPAWSGLALPVAVADGTAVRAGSAPAPSPSPDAWPTTDLASSPKLPSHSSASRGGAPRMSSRTPAPFPFDPIQSIERRPVPQPAAAPEWFRPSPFLGVLAAGSALGMAVGGVLLLCRARRRLARLLARRTPETDARILRTAGELAGEFGLACAPRVSRCALLPSPIAFGLLRPEICVPDRATELGDDELRALLAHEMAHVVRGDAAWLFGGALLQALVPWQFWLVPLRRRLHAIAELRCDAAAARRSDPIAVAQCLVHVASWFDGTARPLPFAHAMAARPSALRQRVEAALRGGSERSLPRGAVALAAGLGLAFAGAAPGLASATEPRVGGATVDLAPAPATVRGPAARTADRPARRRTAPPVDAAVDGPDAVDLHDAANVDAANDAADRAADEDAGPTEDLRDELRHLLAARRTLQLEGLRVLEETGSTAQGDPVLQRLLVRLRTALAASQATSRRVDEFLNDDRRGPRPARRTR